MKTIATFMHSHEAHLLRIRLESVEIPAVVQDDYTVSAVPFLANAIGGVRVQVPDEYYSAARAALGEEPDTVNPRDELVCPNVVQTILPRRCTKIGHILFRCWFCFY